MMNHHRHTTVPGATRRWLAALVVLLLALGSPLAAWAANGDDEPAAVATEEAKDEPAQEPAEEPPAEEPPAEEPPAEEPPAEEPAPEPEPQPEPPANPDAQTDAVKAAQTEDGGGGGENKAQAETLADEPDEPGATSAGGVTPTLLTGNPPCPTGLTELKVNGSTTGVSTDGTLIVDATFSSTPANGSLAWTSNIGLDAVIVKGGSNASLYSYSPEATSDSGLTSPLNPNNEKYYGISHVSYCYDIETTIEVVKDLVPNDDDGLFNLRIDGSTEKADASDGDTTGAVTVSPGTHTVSETAGTDTTLGDYTSSIECVDAEQNVVASGSGTSLEVEAEAGDAIVCTITNTRKTGELEVVKNLVPDTDPGLFNLQIDGTTEKADASDGDTTGAVTVDTGTHTVGEAAGTGTSLDDYTSSIECRDEDGQGDVVASANGVGPLNVEVGADDDIVCVITNTRDRTPEGTIELKKDTEPDGAGLFNLFIKDDGGGTVDSESDVGDGTTGASTVSPGTYEVSETAGTGTDLDDFSTTISCIDTANNDAAVTATLANGHAWDVAVDDEQAIVCTITNTRKTGELEVVKDLSPDDDPGLFDLQIDGSTAFADASDGDTTGAVTVDTGTHSVGEIAGTGTNLGDYASDISCVDEDGQGAEVASTIGTGPLDVEVGDGDHIVCTITNVFVAVAGQPIITVQKTNDADDDGTFRNQERGTEGDPVEFKVVIRNVSAVPVVITEITDTFGGQTINICPELIGVTINPGGSETCFFTLDDYVPAPGDLLENTVTVRGHSADDDSQTVEASDDSAVNSIEVLGGITDTGTDTSTDEGTTLAFTGAELLVLALMALALIVAGTPLLLITRRRGESLDG